MWLDATSSIANDRKHRKCQLQVIDPFVPELFESRLQGSRQDTDRRHSGELAANVGTFCLP